eukprot:PhF_6_TR470/c0_g1_i1/m.210
MMKLLIAVFAACIVLSAAQPRQTTVTGKFCKGELCDVACMAYTVPNDVCNSSRRHTCYRNAICLDITVFSRGTCGGFENNARRISGKCDGDIQGGFSSFTYLGDNQLQIKLNCSDSACSNCKLTLNEQLGACFAVGNVSGSVSSLGFCNYVAFQRFRDSSCSVAEGQFSVEENVCYGMRDFTSMKFNCNWGPEKENAVAVPKRNNEKCQKWLF